jgi:hypothetical protein
MQSEQLAQIFDQQFLTELQDRQQVLKKSEVGALFDKYKGAQTTTKASQQKMLEQIMLALPLWLMTLPKPAGTMDYIRCMTEIDEDLQSALRRIRRSFELE